MDGSGVPLRVSGAHSRLVKESIPIYLRTHCYINTSFIPPRCGTKSQYLALESTGLDLDSDDGFWQFMMTPNRYNPANRDPGFNSGKWSCVDGGAGGMTQDDEGGRMWQDMYEDTNCEQSIGQLGHWYMSKSRYPGDREYRGMVWGTKVNVMGSAANDGIPCFCFCSKRDDKGWDGPCESKAFDQNDNDRRSIANGPCVTQNYQDPSHWGCKAYINGRPCPRSNRCGGRISHGGLGSSVGRVASKCHFPCFDFQNLIVPVSSSSAGGGLLGTSVIMNNTNHMPSNYIYGRKAANSENFDGSCCEGTCADGSATNTGEAYIAARAKTETCLN